MMSDFRSKTQDIKEVKAGETGSGLLIERDGHIVGNSDTVMQIHEDISANKQFVIPDHFVVSAVFQKYGIKNANGRIYPEEILKREVSRYMKERVATRCAVGALDHPSCQLADTKVLTENGWVDIADVKVGDNILTITADKKIEVHPVERKIDEHYKGKLIHLKGRFIDIKVTPNHKFPLLDRKNNFKGFYTAQEILENKVPDQSHSKFFKMGEWHGDNDAEFVIEPLVLHPESLTITEEDYDGQVYCVEVKNHTFYTMCPDGHCLWSGNSSTISGHDISHNILDLRWEGRTLVGEMELHLSPGFRRYGVCSTSGDLVACMIIDNLLVGVSSRALGSVESKFDALYVGDDLELVCWDVVLEPSTSSAYIKRTPEELAPFIEGEQKGGSNLLEKISKIKAILNG